MDVQIHNSWKELLCEEFQKPYFETLTKFVKDAYQKNIVYPKPGDIFRAFNDSPLDTTKVVILGQDPYHGKGQANGLCFAVHNNITPPPSLKNVFKEIESDLGKRLTHTDGDLRRWSNQGVLLLNATLTVEAHKPGSHQNKGWETFTDAVIQKLSDKKKHLVFLLWGNYARQKGSRIDRNKHLVLEAAHPSPFSAHNGFFGCKHFSKTNEYLQANNISPIDWL